MKYEDFLKMNNIKIKRESNGYSGYHPDYWEWNTIYEYDENVLNKKFWICNLNNKIKPNNYELDIITERVERTTRKCLVFYMSDSKNKHIELENGFQIFDSESDMKNFLISEYKKKIKVHEKEINIYKNKIDELLK